jgi:uncharacterized protein YfaS (alpha-2-macroglobulin family)
MHKHLVLLFCFFFALQGIHAQELPPNYNEDWQKVYRFELEDLPRSALKLVDQIQARAKKDNNSPQYIKTLIYQAKFSLLVEEEAQLKIIQRLETEIAKAKSPDKQFLQSILADLYWQYYEKNRWRFQNRTATAERVNTDFRTWDLRQITQRVHQLYQGSLEEEETLKSQAVLNYASILDRVPGSQKYRPSVYDFLAHRALDFYSKEESGLTQPADQFQVDNPLVFASNAAFIAWELPAESPLHFSKEALRLYQKLTQLHLNNPKALSALTLLRLNYAHKKSNLPESESLFEDALKQQIATFSGSNKASFELKLANLYLEQADRYQPNYQEKFRYHRKKALELATNIQQNYAETEEAIWADLMQKSIESPKLELQTEKYLPKEKAGRIQVGYRNLEKLHLKALKIRDKDFEILENMKKDSLRLEYIKKLELQKEWTAPLAAQNDYQQHETEILMPSLPSGHYLILATLDPEHELGKPYSLTFIQYTDLVLVRTGLNGFTRYEVLDRNNGNPIAGARINLRSNAKRYKLNRNLVTDKKGIAVYKTPDYYPRVTATVQTENDRAIFGRLYLYRDWEEDDQTPKETNARAFVFTDRSIYRPGQTLYFKVIAMAYDSRTPNDPRLVTNESLKITLTGPNSKKVKEQIIELNDYGSLAGKFSIPSTGLTGRYRILIEKASDGEVFGKDNFAGLNTAYNSFSVEEYKRPRFETSFEPITQSYKVNDSVLVEGKATAYSGSRVTEAKVIYRVVRKPQYPRWYRWYYPDLSTSSTEITQGETITDEKGQYRITFKAIPDADADPSGLPVFNYNVYADVTDINGETRSTSTRIKVGYHSLVLNLTVPNEIDRKNKKASVSVSTKNLNGEDVSATGTLEIYKLEAPSQVLRERPWPVPEIPGFKEAEFRALFPHDAFSEQEVDIKLWPKGELLWKKSFDSSTDEELTLGGLRKWPLGRYVAVLKSKDSGGKEVKDEQFFDLFEKDSKEVADQRAFYFKHDQSRYAPGEEVKLQIGTALEELHVILEVEKNQKIVERRSIQLNKEVKEFSFAVGQEDLGGFNIRYHWSGMNSFDSGAAFIDVPYPEHKLEISTQSFRDKMQPGTPEKWSFQIYNQQKKGADAELLASMYDASLDVFRSHSWQMRARNPQIYRPLGNTQADLSFEKENFTIYNFPRVPFYYSEKDYSELNWFGLRMNNTRWSQRTYLQELRFFKEGGSGTETITGTILDEDGVPLPGVNVVVKGTSRGTQTDFDGRFRIRVKKGEELLFTYIGMKLVTRTVDRETAMTLTMENDSQALEEVVVTGYGSSRRRRRRESIEAHTLGNAEMAKMSMAAPSEEVEIVEDAELAAFRTEESPRVLGLDSLTLRQSKADLAQIKARTNLQENAFFFPQLRTDNKGNVSFEFTSPEALTRWKLQLLAHDKGLNVGQQTLTTVTQKELMVLPNPPRFLRESDTLFFSTKIASLRNNLLEGTAQLELTNPFTGESLDAALSNTNGIQQFSIPPKGNTALDWTLIIPKGVEAVQYRIVAKSGQYSDGEQSILPVLKDRLLVTESIPLWVKSGERKSFELEKLSRTSSSTRTNHQLTLEITSNPVWYAVQALPYLMEYPFECAEQTFARYFANSLGGHIANSNPKIKEIFKSWLDSETLVSNLEKNPELKAIILQETPWVRDAQSETEQKKRIGLLFDLVRLEEQQESTLRKLQELQRSNGGFTWFKGSRYANRYMTQHIVSGFGHLSKLTGKKDPKWQEMMKKAVEYLDRRILSDYEDLLEVAADLRESAKPKSKGIFAEKDYMARRHIGYTQLHYLYMRSFYPELTLSDKTEAAYQYYLDQAKEYRTDFNLYSQGLNTLVQQRSGDTALAQDLWKSLQENSTQNEELGMYWNENTAGWFWYEAPVETQALMIEAAQEVLAEGTEKTQQIDAMKTWLLKNKQTNRWNSTKSTTEAIYALLLNGEDWMNTNNPVKVNWGGQEVLADPADMQAGTGYFKITRKKEEVSAVGAKVTLEKPGSGIAWGGLYWQYFEDLDKITSAETPLQLSKKLFRKENTPEGEKLFALEEGRALKLGDLIRVRIEIKVDREMEFVHMKDMRAAGLEPVDVLSKYKYQDGLGYYQSTRDAATNFFFDRLPKGVFVFEYDLRVNNAGQFSNGITTIQCMYAPEFTSHSEGVRIEVVNE